MVFNNEIAGQFIQKWLPDVSSFALSTSRCAFAVKCGLQTRLFFFCSLPLLIDRPSTSTGRKMKKSDDYDNDNANDEDDDDYDDDDDDDDEIDNDQEMTMM